MIRRPPSSTRTDTLFPYTTLFRSNGAARRRCACLAQIPGQGLSGSHERNPSARDVGGCEGAPTRLTCRPQMDAAFTAGRNPARRRRAQPPELRQSCVFRYALSSKIATGEKSDPRHSRTKQRHNGKKKKKNFT